MNIPTSYVFIAIAAVITAYVVIAAAQQSLNILTVTLQLIAVICMQTAQFFKGE